MSETRQDTRSGQTATGATSEQSASVREFSSPSEVLGKVDARCAGALVAAASDVALAIDSDGRVSDVAFGESSVDEWRKLARARWLGKRWVDAVTVESRPKVEEMLRVARDDRPSRWRQINFPASNGPDLPVLCRSVPAGDGRTLVLGRDLRPLAELQQRLVDMQLQVERDFSRRRQLETRYRLLFQVSAEPTVIADATSGKMAEANPAAGRLLGSAPEKLVGRAFPDGFDAAGTRAINALLAGVLASGRTDQVRARHKKSGIELVVSASMFRQESGPLFLIQLQPEEAATDAADPADSMVMRVVDESPDGFVVTDDHGRILLANRAFLHLAQVATEETARGESLERWVGRPGADFALLLGNLHDHGSVRRFSTALRCEFGSTVDVELAAVAVPQANPPCLGFTVRNVGPRAVNGEGSRAIRDLPRSVDQLTDLVGRVKLKELVRESTDMVERLCIEAALELSGDNRSSAAEILGLSRQSLYVKLRRYGLGDLDSIDDA